MSNLEYVPGSTIDFDRYGNIVDRSASITERWCALGYSWIIDSGYQSLSSSGDYYTINFKTPATGRVFYNLATINKSGNELVSSLIEAGTYSGGSALTPKNYNRDVADSACTLTSVVGGLSTASATVTGGTEMAIRLAPGTAQGNSIPGGSSALSGVFTLKQNTNYTFKILAKDAATFAVNVAMAVVASAV